VKIEIDLRGLVSEDGDLDGAIIDENALDHTLTCTRYVKPCHFLCGGKKR